MLATRLQFDAFGLAFSPLDHFYSRTFRDRILSDVKALDHLDFQLRFGNKVPRGKDDSRGGEEARIILRAS